MRVVERIAESEPIKKCLRFSVDWAYNRSEVEGRGSGFQNIED